MANGRSLFSETPMLFYLKRLNASVERTMYWMTVSATLLFIVFVLLGVISRYLTRSPILGSIEMSRLFFVWACFLAASLGYRKQAHISLSFLTGLLPDKIRKALDLGIDLLCLIFFMMILSGSLRVTGLLWATQLPASGYSQGWFYVPVVIASVTMALFAAEQFAIKFSPPHRSL